MNLTNIFCFSLHIDHIFDTFHLHNVFFISFIFQNILLFLFEKPSALEPCDIIKRPPEGICYSGAFYSLESEKRMIKGEDGLRCMSKSISLPSQSNFSITKADLWLYLLNTNNGQQEKNSEPYVSLLIHAALLFGILSLYHLQFFKNKQGRNPP